MTTYPADLSAHFESARAAFNAVVDELMDERTRSMDHGDVEALVDTNGREILRQLFQGHLCLRTAHEERQSMTGADGIARAHMKPSSRALGSLFGVVLLVRIALTARGAEGGLRPLDAELNMPAGKHSFGVRRRAAELVASVPTTPRWTSSTEPPAPTLPSARSKAWLSKPPTTSMRSMPTKSL